MNVNTKTVVEKIYKLCGIRVVESDRDRESIIFVSAEERGTDSFTLNMHPQGGYSVEIHPADIPLNSDELVRIECVTIEECCKIYDAIMTYKKMIVDKNVQLLVDML